MDSINLYHWNARSLLANRAQLLGSEWLSHADIVLLQETWLSPGTPFTIPGFTIFRLDRPNGNGGGLITAVAKRWTAAQVPASSPTTDLEILRVDLLGPSGSLTVYNVYIPHGNISAQDLVDTFGSPQPPFFIGVDWNAHHSLWDPSIARPNRAGSSTFSWYLDTGICILNSGLPTHFQTATTASAIDLSFCSPDLLQGSTWRPLPNTYGSLASHFRPLRTGSFPPAQLSHRLAHRLYFSLGDLSNFPSLLL